MPRVSVASSVTRKYLKEVRVGRTSVYNVYDFFSSLLWFRQFHASGDELFRNKTMYLQP